MMYGSPLLIEAQRQIFEAERRRRRRALLANLAGAAALLVAAVAVGLDLVRRGAV